MKYTTIDIKKLPTKKLGFSSSWIMSADRNPRQLKNDMLADCAAYFSFNATSNARTSFNERGMLLFGISFFISFIGLDDLLDQPVSHHIPFGKIDDHDIFDTLENPDSLHKP